MDPDDAVRAHRPAATAAGVLSDDTHVLDARRHEFRAHPRRLEHQRRLRPLGVQRRERQVDGIGDVPRPHVGPLETRLEAAARDGLPVVELPVADLIDAVLLRLFERECIQAIEQSAARSQPGPGRHLRDDALLALRICVAVMKCIAPQVAIDRSHLDRCRCPAPAERRPEWLSRIAARRNRQRRHEAARRQQRAAQGGAGHSRHGGSGDTTVRASMIPRWTPRDNPRRCH